MLSAPQAEGTSERLSPEPQADEILSPEPQAVDLSFVPQAELMEVLEVFLFQSFKLESAIIIPPKCKNHFNELIIKRLIRKGNKAQFYNIVTFSDH